MFIGAQTVTVRNFTAGQRDRLNQPARVPAETIVTGCSMQPMSVNEVVALTDVETQLWKCLLPPVSAALTADTTSEIVYNNTVYQVLGAQPSVDFMGNTDHVALDLKVQNG